MPELLAPIFAELAQKKGNPDAWRKVDAAFQDDGLFDVGDLEDPRVTQTYINALLQEKCGLGQGYRVILEGRLDFKFYVPAAADGFRSKKRDRDIKEEV